MDQVNPNQILNAAIQLLLALRFSVVSTPEARLGSKHGPPVVADAPQPRGKLHSRP